MAATVKFLHTADWHLDQPLTGLREIPKHLRATLANAPYLAAERTVDAAILEAVDFVLLSGDIADLEGGGPRPSAFLLSQFERLDDKGIRVFWCGGTVDRLERWQATVELPPNVTCVTSTTVERYAVTKKGQPIATILGAAADQRKRAASEFRCEPDDPFPIALSYGEILFEGSPAMSIQYWALGGRHQRQVIEKDAKRIMYPGTPQGRGFQENGAHSCTLGTVDKQGQLKVEPLNTDRVRYSRQTIAAAGNLDVEALHNLLAERALKISAESNECLHLVDWTFSPTGEFEPKYHQASVQQEILSWMRHEFGEDSSGIWSTQFQVQPPRKLPALWYEEDTLLGDFLRSLSQYPAEQKIAGTLNDYFNSTTEHSQLESLTKVPPNEVDQLMKSVALQGVQLLSVAQGEDGVGDSNTTR